nr:YfhO family protein [Butyrivibrio sp.]
DYNVQQIPFYIAAHRAIRNGELFWNWTIDFGTSMIGTFSFYLLGSPFFLLTLPFPESFIPYMMPFIMALKYAVCAATSYTYIRRHVVRDESAMLGALLYAFSGFNACNIVFNHFTDAVAFFPLFLLTFDKLMEIDHHKDNMHFFFGGKELIHFSLMTMVMAIINYYFFFGEVIFLIIYFVIVYIPGNKKRDIIRMFLRALFGGVLGGMLGGFYILQSFLSISGNSRLSETLSGYDVVSYHSMNMLWDILKSMVMIPDIIGKGTVFYTSDVRVASLAVYLPVFGIAGVSAYFLQTTLKKDVHKRLLLACLIMSMIPILNSAFSLFNSEYYARWFYMPILFMAMVTAKTAERGKSVELKRGVLITSFLFILILLISIIPSYTSSGEVVDYGLIENTKIYKKQVIGTAVMTIMLILSVFCVPKCVRKIKLFKMKEIGLKKPIMRIHVLLFATIIGCVISTYVVLSNGSSLISDYGKEQWELQMLNTVPELEGDEFYRDETDDTATNYDMVWGIGSLHSFISTLPAETFDFLDVVDIDRKVETKISNNLIGIRAILSQKYYLENERINDSGYFEAGDGIEGFIYLDSQNGFDIYLNTNYIKMGFAYDYFIRESDFEEIDNTEIKDRLLSVAVVLSDDDADALKGVLKELPEDYYIDTLPYDIFEKNCEERNKTSCETFETSTNGFTARSSNLDSDKLLFFSVPAVKGFTVYVDGKEAEIIKADYGMTAVMVPAGVHEIKATYIPDGFYAGFFMTVTGIAVLLLYMAVVHFYKHRQM